MLNFITLSKDHTEASLASVGAKAFHLKRAINAGLPVPGGIVIPAEVLDSFASGYASLQIPGWFIDEVMAELENRFPGPWAVRSSGVAEDGAENSFAGQYVTILNVSNREALENAISACFGSRFSDQVSNYNVDGRQSMAVVIQQMVDADVAGVVFSANPLTGERDCVVINAVKGLGEKLVSGETTPEEILFRSGKIERSRGEDVLSDPQVMEVAAIAKKLEKESGCPQDIEWAYKDGQFWLLQTRPVTALPPEPIPIGIDPPKGSWQREDHCPVATEMGWDTWYSWYNRSMTVAFREYGAPVEAFEFARIGGSIYSRVKVEGDDGKAPPPKFILWLVTRLLPSFRKYNKIAVNAMKEGLHRNNILRWDNEWKPFFSKNIDAFRIDGLDGLSDGEIIGTLEKIYELGRKGADVHAKMGACHIITQGQFAIFCKKHFGWSNKEIMSKTTGFSGGTTMLTNELDEVVDRFMNEIKGAGPELQVNVLFEKVPGLENAVQSLIRKHSLRILNYDLNNPTLGEKPGIIYQNLRTVIDRRLKQNGGQQVPNADLGALLKEGESLENDKLKKEYELLVKWMAKGVYNRDENGPDSYGRIFGLMRLYLLEAGKRISELDCPEDVFFLKREELVLAINRKLEGIADLIRTRKGQYQWAKLNKGPKFYGPVETPPPADAFPSGLRQVFEIIGWMEEVEKIDSSLETENLNGNTVKGNGVFAGEYTGVARVIAGPDEFDQVKPGEILVCRITSGEWSVVFSRVGALVTDEGGLLSHPAIIAREFGIPAVVGTVHATKRIRTGDRVTVNGANGTVTLH